MSYATMTTKGQITIPNYIRKQFGLSPGDRLEFHVRENREAIYMVPSKKEIREVSGFLAHRAGKKKVSVEEMNTNLKKKFKRDHS